MHVTARASASPVSTAGPQDARRFRPAARLAWPAGLTVAALTLFGCYLRLSSTQRVTADGASQALQAWDMLHGNWLLHGWTLTDVSFYTTELPQYVLIEAADGLRPDVVHLAGAMTYTLLVLAAGLLARGRSTGRAGLIRLLVACGIMLAPQPLNGVGILLNQPDHVGTMVPVLLIWMLLDRAPRRWYVPVAAGTALAWVQVADRLVLTVAVLPLAGVCAFRAYQGIVRHREPLAKRWPELWLGAAALASTPAAMITSRVLGRLGGYASRPLANGFAPAASWPSHVVVAAQGILALYGSDVTGQPFAILSAVALVHLAGLALAGWLAAHHLTTGLASYAQANSVTLASGGAVQLRAPDWTRHGVRPGAYASRSSWFDPRLHDATFVVSTKANGWGFWISYQEVTSAFGRPAHTYHYGGDTIWTWRQNLLTRLHPGD
jgi:hypothetical protein